MAKPIKIPAGSTHDEPSWKERLKEVAEDYKNKGGQKGIYQRALTDILHWRGPSNKIPAILPKEKVDSAVSKRTNLGNSYIGKVGVWIQQECATGQVLYIWLPDVNKLSEKSILRSDFVIEDSTGYRYNYAPASVIAILKRGYPVP